MMKEKYYICVYRVYKYWQKKNKKNCLEVLSFLFNIEYKNTCLLKKTQTHSPMYYIHPSVSDLHVSTIILVSS